MASTEYLAALGANVKPGDKLADVLTARRFNALLEGVRSLTKGENLSAGPGVSLKKSPAGVVVMGVQSARADSPQPRLVSVEITLDADTAPTSAQINAALVAFYADDTRPREGDTFRISRADNSHPEIEVQLTATALGPDWRFSPNSAVTIQEKPWYRVVRDISGRTYFENTASKITADAAGVKVLNKTGSKSFTVDPASITADMVVRDLPVLVGSEVKLSRVVASAPVSQSPPVMLAGSQEYLEGGGIRFLDSETDAKYITVYLPEIALDDDQTGGTLIKLEYVPATLPGGGEGVRLKYSSRITDKTDSKVRLLTDTSGETWYFNLDAGTLELLGTLAEIPERVDELETTTEEQTEEISGLQSAVLTLQGQVTSLFSSVSGLASGLSSVNDDIMALQGDLLSLDNRIGFAEEDITALKTRATNIESAATTLKGRVDELETTTEEQTEEISGLQTAISGATISCDETGVTLTWGTPPP